MLEIQRHSALSRVSNLGRRVRRRLDRLCHDVWMLLAHKRVIRTFQDQWPQGKPLVSVIIPCYNYGLFIREAIECIQAQTFDRFEIIVINDGSTDEFTLSELSKLQYPKTRIINQENQGLAQTRNIGAQMAVGKYICYLDADDRIDSSYLKKAISVLEADLSIGACYSWVQCFGIVEKIWKTLDLDPYYLHQYTTASSNGVIRKDVWEVVKARNGVGFISRFNGYFEDWVFWIDMVESGYRGVTMREPLIYYRVHHDSLSARHRNNFQKMLEELKSQRPAFFYNARYRKTLCKKLNRRVYPYNPYVNL